MAATNLINGVRGIASSLMGNGTIQIPPLVNVTETPAPLLLSQAPILLTTPWLPMEAGYALNNDGMYHVAANTMMKGLTHDSLSPHDKLTFPDVTGDMIEWWFGWVLRPPYKPQLHTSITS